MEAVEKLQPGVKPEPFLHRILNAVERAGNFIPNPAILFVILAAIVVVASVIV